MKNIILVSAIFPPEPIVSARTSQSIAHELTKLGYSVKVLTNFPNRPVGQIYEGYKRSIFSSENTPSGYSITRCFSTFSKSSSIFSRLLENVSFGFSSSLFLLFAKKPNVVYCNSWPVFATGLTVLICKLRRIPVIVSVQDIYPESIFIQGRITVNHVLYKLLLKVDTWIAKQARKLILISQKQSQGYIPSRYIEPEKVHIIPNWLNRDSIQLMDKDVFRKQVGITSDAFLFVYGGNIGKAAGLPSLIKELRHIRTQREVILLIAGSGSELSECQKLSNEIDNIKIIIHSPWEEKNTSAVLAAADILLLPTNGSQSLVSVPSKLITYMLSAKPVCAIVLPDSETAQVITEAKCGWVISPLEKSTLHKHIEEIANTSPEELSVLGLSARNYAIQNFTSENALSKLVNIFETLVTFERKL